MRAIYSVLVLALVVVVPGPGESATFTVTKTADTADGVCDADCSLREAVVAANGNGGSDVVEVPPGTYLLDHPSGGLTVDDDAVIRGTGPSASIVDGDGNAFTFRTIPPTSIEIVGLTIEGGLNDGVVNTSGAGTLTVRDCTIRDNIIGLNNGNSQKMNVINSTISGNTSGVIRDFLTTTTLENVTITGNGTGIGGNPATLNLTHTIVAENSTINCTASSTASSSSNSMDDDGTCGLSGSGDLSNVADAALAPLQDNGSSTETHALCTGAMQPDASCAGASPALDAGSNDTCNAVDQRGFPRADGDADGLIHCDIGAFEAQRSDPLKCYKAKDLKNPKFVKIQNPGISLDDELIDDGDVDVKKPFLFCAPADKDGAGIVNETAHLCCYKIKGAKLDPAVEVGISDDFGSLELQVKKPFVLCQPCARTVL